MNTFITFIMLITILLSLSCVLYSWVFQKTKTKEGLEVKMEHPHVSDSEHREECTKDKNKCCPGLYVRNDCNRFVFNRPSVFSKSVQMPSVPPTVHTISENDISMSCDSIVKPEYKMFQDEVNRVVNIMINDDKMSLADSLVSDSKTHVAKICDVHQRAEDVSDIVVNEIQPMNDSLLTNMGAFQIQLDRCNTQSENVLNQNSQHKTRIRDLYATYCKDYSYNDSKINTICQQLSEI